MSTISTLSRVPVDPVRTFCRAGIPLFWPADPYFTASALFQHRGHCLSPCWQCHCHTDIGPQCEITWHCETQETACMRIAIVPYGTGWYGLIWFNIWFGSVLHIKVWFGVRCATTLAFVLPTKPMQTTEFPRSQFTHMWNSADLGTPVSAKIDDFLEKNPNGLCPPPPPRFFLQENTGCSF